jgi:hypothetical protein
VPHEELPALAPIEGHGAYGARRSYTAPTLGRVLTLGHRDIRGPPAMAVGIADHIWTGEEIAALLD